MSGQQQRQLTRQIFVGVRWLSGGRENTGGVLVLASCVILVETGGMSMSTQQVQERAAAWRRVNAMEARLASQELPGLDTAKVLEYLRPAFEQAQRAMAPEPTSGLVEQQQAYHRRHGD